MDTYVVDYILTVLITAKKKKGKGYLDKTQLDFIFFKEHTYHHVLINLITENILSLAIK